MLRWPFHVGESCQLKNPYQNCQNIYSHSVGERKCKNQINIALSFFLHKVKHSSLMNDWLNVHAELISLPAAHEDIAGLPICGICGHDL